jgi:hypothetical protein
MTRVMPSLLGLAVALCAGCQTKSTPPPAPGPAEVKVEAGELIKAYRTNAINADATYKGKTIEISGRFDSVQKGGIYGYVIMLTPEGGGDETVSASSVMCVLLPEAHEEAAKLKGNDRITLKGVFDGPVLGGTMKVNKCTFVH